MKKSFLIKVFYPHEIYKYQTHFIRRFLKKTRTTKWQNTPIKVFLKVSYGREENWQDKKENFYNDGYYENRSDFELALNAFVEEK